MQKKSMMLALLAGVAVSGAAQAALSDSGDGTIRDDVLNINWLKNANLAATNTFGVSGISSSGEMTWDTANSWIAAMNTADYLGHDDWRLPTMVDTGVAGCNYAHSGTDCGYNVQTVSGSTVYSEMAYMYYVNLGLKGHRDTSGNYRSDWGIFGNGTCNGTDCSSFGQNDVGLIDNLQADDYWSGLEFAPNPNFAWLFDSRFGFQSAYYKDDELYAWAVRPGDVAAVPEPSTLVLLGLAMAGLGALRRRG